MRILVVVDGELTCADERGEWALLEALVAANGPEPPEVRVMALVSRARPGIAAGSPPYPPMAIMTSRSTAGSPGGHPAESARQRLTRALHYLHELGLQASGDIEPGNARQAARR